MIVRFCKLIAATASGSEDLTSVWLFGIWDLGFKVGGLGYPVCARKIIILVHAAPQRDSLVLATFNRGPFIFRGRQTLCLETWKD